MSEKMSSSGERGEEWERSFANWQREKERCYRKPGASKSPVPLFYINIPVACLFLWNRPKNDNGTSNGDTSSSAADKG